ncbi:hypothetical protein B0H16DRAFT_1452770 [Mycena metata]|uniref:CxC2-like cysteine cluster KDZ transposase-associated domain-containing protein n=1 Tax=Mycena metata TaxID=1033252 RepID=A0AAD7JNV7_9AGAR|nr:hypothetical protein B0H16DRAFT_1452770 [Mycena metata]
MDPPPNLSFRGAQYLDTAVGMKGERPHDSTRVGDRGIFISDDGESRSETLRNVTYKRRRFRLRPENLNDSLAHWIPVLDDGELDDNLRATLDSISSEDTRKRKFYASSDDPMAEFRDIQQVLLDEMLRLCGLADSADDPECAVCQAKLDKTSSAYLHAINRAAAAAGEGLLSTARSEDEAPPDGRIFRCADCGEFLQCKNCCLERHSMTPLHFLKVWNGEFWVGETLKSLGLIYQLGHQGAPCPRPNAVVRSLVVLDTTGVHEIKYRQCGCARAETLNPVKELVRNAWYPASATNPDTCATLKALDMFRVLNVIGNVNAHDFVTALERLTDGLAAAGMTKIPDRYKAFLRMSRQYSFLERVKHMARAHDPEGLVATKQGQCLVKCWTCPFSGRNLVPGWCDVDPKYRYLYRLILAMDANFKLKNRMRANEWDDPSLGPGWGAFMEPTQYKEHLKNYVAEHDISTCIAFAALTQKETRNTTGLRISGLGGTVCARHKLVRPNGLGDLQKGERYANMDFIVMSSLAGFDLMELTISYDVACQWQKNLLARIAKLPANMRPDFDVFMLQCGLPVWHVSSHEEECTNTNSLSFLQGVGKSDGEGIERLWAELNAFAYHTKNMGVGHRADTIEDKIDYHNFTKNLGQANILKRKLVVAIAERARQVEAFKEVNKSVPSDVRSAWQARVDAFHEDKTKPNPYLVRSKDGPTEAEIRALLKKDEEEAAGKGAAPLHGTSTTAFLTAGLQLEETQRRIKAQITGALMTADRESKIQEQRLAFLAKLRTFRALQQIYTPAAIRAVERVEARRVPDVPAVRAENISLFLPSSLTTEERGVGGCQDGLPGMEARLREAQCTDARACMPSVMCCIGGRGTPATLVAQITERINVTADKYCAARRALRTLKGDTYRPDLKPLKEADLTLNGDVKDSESDAKKKLSSIAAGKGGRVPRHVAGTSKTVMSWIWAARGALDPEEKDLHEWLVAALQVEWAKAKARKNRWEEEVNLLHEEMRRLLRYLTWEAGEWDARAGINCSDVPAAVQAGLRAYARKQAEMHRSLGAFYFEQLSAPLEKAATALQVEDDDLPSLFTEGTDVEWILWRSVLTHLLFAGRTTKMASMVQEKLVAVVECKVNQRWVTGEHGVARLNLEWERKRTRKRAAQGREVEWDPEILCKMEEDIEAQSARARAKSSKLMRCRL